MNSAYIYLQIYKLFDKHTPISVDCGELCGAACCAGDDCGMFLFPGEWEVYRLLSPEGFRIECSDLTYTYNGNKIRTPLLVCDGKCDRFMRPLACRIFPLTPILDKDGNISVITDPRAKSLCPLAKTFYMNEYDEEFVRSIRKAFGLLKKNKQVFAFLQEYTKYIEEFLRFFN